MYGMVWYGMVWYGMVWYGMVWYGMVWYSIVWYRMGFEVNGAALVQASLRTYRLFWVNIISLMCHNHIQHSTSNNKCTEGFAA
jgi:hypothetical protein